MLAVATGAAIGSSMARNKAAQQQQQQMYQQQTQAEINSANAQAQAAKAEAQAAQAQAAQAQAQATQVAQAQTMQAQPTQNPAPMQYMPAAPIQQQAVDSGRYMSTQNLDPPVFLELVCPHIVNEEAVEIRQNQIISVPMGAVVKLVRGSLTTGLGAPYQDYIEVEYNGRVGKISRLVVKVASSAPGVPRAIGM